MTRSRSIGTTFGFGAVLTALILGGAVSGARAQDNGDTGSWQRHQVDFAYLGISPTYSCDGLESSLTFLLQQSGAKLNQRVNAYPCAGFGTPTKLLSARLDFSTLAPAAAGGAQVPAGSAWRHVEFSPTHSSPQLHGSDCELVQEFQDKVLPNFTTRNVKANLHCVPYQTIGNQFSLSFDVLAPAGAPARAVGGAD